MDLLIGVLLSFNLFPEEQPCREHCRSLPDGGKCVNALDSAESALDAPQPALTR